MKTFTNKQKRRIATLYAQAFDTNHPINDMGDGFCDGYANVDGSFVQGSSTVDFYPLEIIGITPELRADRVKYRQLLHTAWRTRKAREQSRWPAPGRLAKV